MLTRAAAAATRCVCACAACLPLLQASAEEFEVLGVELWHVH
jgi:hypothetical protein